MFDFGFWEMALIVVVALVVVGPERLPGLAREAGMWIGRVKGFVNNAKSELKKEFRASEFQQMLENQQNEIRELRSMLKDTESELKSELKETEHLVKSIEDQIEASGDTLNDSPSAPPHSNVERITEEHDKQQESR